MIENKKHRLDEKKTQKYKSMMLKKGSRRHRTLEERAQEYGGKIGPYEEFDWGIPMGRER